MTIKRFLHVLRPIGLLGVGLLLAAGSAFLAAPSFAVSDVQTGAFLAATPTQAAASEVGSTDWITLVSFIIVLIVITPILVRRKSWDQ